jgi:hypothetical protein
MVNVYFRRAMLGLAVFGAAGGILLGAADRLTPQDAARMQQKIALIMGHVRPAGTVSARTQISEIEVNSYLRYGIGAQMPTGITDPAIVIVGDGRLTGTAVVDLSLASKEGKSGGIFDPLSYLTGRLPVAASGVLRTRSGVGTFELESASISSVPIPKRVLQELLTAYSRSETDPDGLGLDDPFALPADIREIEIKPGLAVVVQ